MFLMIDNYDSFVYNLVRYFHELDQDVLVRRNDRITVDEVRAIAPDGIIFSPGPKFPQDAGVCLELIRELQGEIPILGICLGHQSIGVAFGGTVSKGPRPMHGKVTPIRHDGKGIFEDIPAPLQVTRYHSLVIDRETLPSVLEISAVDEAGVIMGVRHRKYLIEGVQFHPEAELSEKGHDLLRNFIRAASRNG